MRTVHKLALPLIVVSGIVGLGIGLLLGWQVWPVQWYDTDPSDLRLEHQQAYVQLVADSFTVTAKADVAARRLLELTDEDTSWEQVASLVEQVAVARVQAGDKAAALRIRRMAQAAKLPAPGQATFEPVGKRILPASRSLLMAVAIAAFCAALGMLAWVVIRLVKGRTRKRDALGPIPEGYESEELPMASGPKPAILWEEEIESAMPSQADAAPAPSPRDEPEMPLAIPSLRLAPASISSLEETDEDLEATFASTTTELPTLITEAAPVPPAIEGPPGFAEPEPPPAVAPPEPSPAEVLPELPPAEETPPIIPAPPTPAVDAVPVAVRPPSHQATKPSGALAVFEAEYLYGDDDFDCSFTIETDSGEFLGECGLGISDVLSADDAQRVNAFEVWLFDKSDIRTISKVLVTQHTFEDQELNARLSAKGDLIMVRQGLQINLETLTLQVTAVVSGFGYVPGDELSMSAFAQMNVKMTVSQVD